MGSKQIAKTERDGNYARELKKLRGRHHKILQLHATGKFNNKEIAEMLGITPQTVCNTINSQLGQRKLQHLYSDGDEAVHDLLDEIQSIAPIALAELEEALLSDEVSRDTRISVAQDILDRAGYGKTKNVNLRKKEVTDDDIEKAKERAKKTAEDAGMVADANVIEETKNRESEPSSD